MPEAKLLADPSTAEDSGRTVLQPAAGDSTAAIKSEVAAQAGPGCAFGRIQPDASPGWNTLTISGFPAGTRAISVWMTEWIGGNQPHAGAAWFTTTSVQLFDNGTKCRVRFHLEWGRHLPAAFQAIFC